MTTFSVPNWAQFFTRPEYDAFVEAVAEDLRRRGEVTFADGMAELDMGDGGRHRLGLQNLAQMCNQIEVDQWEGFIREHFDRVIVSTQSHDLDEIGRDFAVAGDLLKVRLYASEALTEFAEGTVARPLGDSLAAVLVYDLPDAVATVPPHVARAWPCTLDEAFEIGLRNVIEQDPVEVQPIELEDGVRFFAMVGDSFFVTSRLLALDDYIETMPTMGSIVAVPNRHMLLYAPILDISVIGAIQAMAVLALRRFEEGPGSLAPTVFWWRDGDLTPLPVDISDAGVEFTPPDEFVDVCLERLANPSAYGPN